MLRDVEKIYKELESICNYQPNKKRSAELRARNRASIVSPVIYKMQDGRRVIDKEETDKRFEKIYQIFLKAEMRNNA